MEKIEKLTKLVMNELEEMVKNGGEGSGDFDHAGNPPHVGGSEPVESREKRGFKSKSERKEVKKEEKKYKPIAEGIKKDFEGKEIPQKIKEDFKKTYGVDLTEEENKDKLENPEKKEDKKYKVDKRYKDNVKHYGKNEHRKEILSLYKNITTNKDISEGRKKEDLEYLKFHLKEYNKYSDTSHIQFYGDDRTKEEKKIKEIEKWLKTQNKANNSLYKHEYIEY